MHDVDKGKGSPHVRWVLSAVATVAIAATLVTCKSVTDNVLSPRQPATETANCMSECAHAANEAMRVESDTHVDNVHACKNDKACKDQEQARHQAAVDQIQDGRKACQNNCHHQGGGKGH